MAAANSNIPPPAKFDPKTDDWDHWIKRYELFEAATERDGLSDKEFINTPNANMADLSAGPGLSCAKARLVRPQEFVLTIDHRYDLRYGLLRVVACLRATKKKILL